MPRKVYDKDKQIEANKKWAERNPERFKELSQRNLKLSYERHREQRIQKSLEWYYKKRERELYGNYEHEAKVFRKILL